MNNIKLNIDFLILFLLRKKLKNTFVYIFFKLIKK